MPDSFPTFPLFLDPVAEGSFEPSDFSCACCNRRRGWIHTCASCGPGDNERTICPWCIADGSAAAKFDCSFNDATICPFLDTTPQLTASDRELVERRTPGFVSWQDHGWQVCCARACAYIGEADAADLAGRWAAAIPSILSKLKDWPDADKAGLIRNIRKGGSPCAYVFRCQVCGALKGFWDCD